MKIVIDIPERLKEIADEYSKIDNKELEDITYYRMNEKLALFCISKGTPLPARHGRLGDLDALEAVMRYEVLKHDLNEYGCLSLVGCAPTIIGKGDSE